MRLRIRAFVLFWLLCCLALLIAGHQNPDACETACGPVFTQYLIDHGQDPANPDPRVEHDARIYTESTCIRPCRRQR